ncbi:MAG TPA: phage holin family protein [Dissulfurispiraceae bacterium]
MYRVKEERSLGELFSELSRGMQDLLREEIELAKAEMSQKAFQVVKDVAFLIIGAAVAYTAFLTLVAAAVLGLGTGVPWWLSALIIAVILGVASFALAMKGFRDLKKQDMVPRKTISTLKEDTRWMKEQM